MEERRRERREKTGREKTGREKREERKWGERREKTGREKAGREKREDVKRENGDFTCCYFFSMYECLLQLYSAFLQFHSINYSIEIDPKNLIP